MILSDTSKKPAPRFRVLSDEQCQELYAAALECLQQVGVQMHNAEARQLLAASGADLQDQIVRHPWRSGQASDCIYTFFIFGLGAGWKNGDASCHGSGPFWARTDLHIFY